MNDSTVRYATDGPVARITLNRPDALNALTPQMMPLLREALERAGADPAVRAVLLTGAGRGFCAGADLKQSMPKSRDADLGAALRDTYHPVILAMRSLPKPIVTAVNGPAAGAGMSIALAADIVLAARSASFLQAFTRIGLIPDAGSTWFLPRLAGDIRARAMAILAEPVTAEDALRFGMVWRVFDDDALDQRATEMAERLAAMPTRAIALLKRALESSASQRLVDQLETEAVLQTEAGHTEDFVEGVIAFVHKRAPVFTGR